MIGRKLKFVLSLGVLVLLLTSLNAASVKMPDTGETYRVGTSVDADYPTINEALSAIQSLTFTSDVKLFIEEGLYQETFKISDLNNGDFKLTIVGESQSQTIIRPISFVDTGAAIFISNIDHLSISNLTFEFDDVSDDDASIGSSRSIGITILDSDDIQLESLIVTNTESDPANTITLESSVVIENSRDVVVSSSIFNGAACHIFFPIGSLSESIELIDNRFSEYTYGVNLYVAEIDGLTISGNTFDRVWVNAEPFTADLFLLGPNATSLVNGIVFANNEIIGESGKSWEHAIWSVNVHDLELEGNKIVGRNIGLSFRETDFVSLTSNEIYTNNTTVYAYDLSSGVPSNVQSLRMENNILYSTVEETVLIELNPDIDNQFAFDLYMVHNTLKSEQSKAMYLEELRGSLVLVNNIFSGGDGVDVHYVNIYPREAVDIDHNAYGENQIQIEAFETTDPNTGETSLFYFKGIGGSDSFESLSDWQTTTPYDQNSLAVSDAFFAADDLRLANTSAYRFGDFDDTLPLDLDGDARILGAVDVGADQFNAFREMCGDYTISSTGADFATISEAVESLRKADITCDVNLLLAAGTYDEAIQFSGIDNGDYRISLIGASMESVIIQAEIDADTAIYIDGDHIYLESFTLNTTTMSASKSVGISIHRTEDVSIEKVDIHENNPDPGSPIQPTQFCVVMKEVTNVSVSNSSFFGAMYSIWLEDAAEIIIDNNDFSTSNTHIISKSTPLSDVQVSNNRFYDVWSLYSITPIGVTLLVNPVYAIDLQGISSLEPAKHLEIINNTFENSREEDFFKPSRAMKLRTIDGLRINGNTNKNFAYAIFADSVSSYLEITDNDFKDHASYPALTQEGFGYDADVNVYLQTTDSIYMANNIIVTEENVNLEINDAKHVYLAANTFYLDNGIADTYDVATDDRLVLVQMEEVDHLDLYNNIFHGGDEVSKLLALTTVSANEVDIDHNLYSRNDDAHALDWVGETGTVSSLTEWQSAQPQFNANAEEFTAVLTTDYRLDNAADYRFGTFIADLSEDIDGDVRMDGAVDVGADQYVCEASASGEESVTACDSYDWNGTIYEESGLFTQVLINTLGCDSIASLNLTILESTDSYTEITSNEIYTWNATTYSESGLYSFLTTNQVGCDSTAVLDLIILDGVNFIIGSSEEANFESFESALSFLNTYTFEADVNFTVEIGTYLETINLSGIANGEYTISFVGGEVSNVIVQPTESVNGAGIIIEMDNISFENITFDVPSTSAHAFAMNGTATDSISNVSFTNTIIKAQYAADFSDHVFFEASYLSGFSFVDNEVYFGYNGFEIANSKDVNFKYNRIDGGRNGIYLKNYDDVSVINNIVNVDEEHASWFDQGENLELIYNTFYAKGISNFASARIRDLDGVSTIINNIFGCSGSNANHIGLDLIDVNGNDLTLDYNLYATNAARPFQVTSFVFDGATRNYNNLSNWQSGQDLFDQSSQSFETAFVSEEDLSIVDVGAYRFGHYLEEYTRDIEGDLRASAVGVDVGADQYTTGMEMYTFEFAEQTSEADINLAEGTIEIEVVYGTDITALIPFYTLSSGANATPGNEVIQDFSITIVYTVTNQEGSSSLSYDVTVREGPKPLGISDEGISLTVYPNPVQETIWITASEVISDVTIQIVDLTGKSSLNVSAYEMGNGIDITSLKAGIYFLRILSGDQVVSNERIRIRD